MDDCNLHQALVHDPDLFRSDSSMDDCNSGPRAAPSDRLFVQIPLWTIVTLIIPFVNYFKIVQIPLWTIVTLRDRRLIARLQVVQIPLWTIVTLKRL